MSVHASRRLILVALLVSCDPARRPESPESTSAAQPALANDSAAGSMASEAGDSATARPGASIITPDGWGPLRIGMSRAQVVTAAGEDAQPDAVGGPDPASCDEFRPDAAPPGVLVMIQNGVLTRISVSRTSDIATPEGFRVGDSGSAIVAAYGRQAIVAPHPYWEAPAKYITVWRERDGERRGMRYEVDAADRVAHIRVGDESIEYVEGCV